MPALLRDRSGNGYTCRFLTSHSSSSAEEYAAVPSDGHEQRPQDAVDLGEQPRQSAPVSTKIVFTACVRRDMRHGEARRRVGHQYRRKSL